MHRTTSDMYFSNGTDVPSDRSHFSNADGIRAEKIANFSRVLKGDASTPVDAIIVAAPRHGLSHVLPFLGDARVRNAKHLRIVANGIRFLSVYPDLLTGSSTPETVSVTEWGAYRVGLRMEATRSTRAALGRYLQSVFKDKDAEKIFIGPAGNRLVGWSNYDAMATLVGLDETHPNAVKLFTDPHSMLIHAFDNAPQVGFLARWSWRPTLLGLVFAGIAMSAALAIYRLFLSRSSRALIRTRRNAPEPRIWLAATPDQPRANRHILELEAEAQQYGPVGLLVLPPLLPGVANNEALNKHEGNEPLACIGAFKHNPNAAIEHLSGADSLTSTVVLLYRFAAHSLASAFRAMVTSPVLEVQPAVIDFRKNLTALAKVLTIDVFRRLSCEMGVKRVAKTRKLSGSVVIGSGGGVTSLNAAHVTLQKQGASTLDYFHGWMSEPFPIATEVPASMNTVWASTDVNHEPGQPTTLVAGMAQRYAPHTFREATKPLRLLFLTNYFHRDDHVNGEFQWSAFAHEILGAGAQLFNDAPGQFEFRWRPHPADFQDAVSEFNSKYPMFKVDRTRTLDEEFEWCDGVVSTFSTSAIEALLTGLPVFVHLLPEQYLSPAAEVFSSNRTFVSKEDLMSRLVTFAKKPKPGPEESLTLRRLFPPDGIPQKLTRELERRGFLKSIDGK